MFLITGATGMVGRTAVRLLTERGLKVVAVTRDPHAALPPEAQLVHPDEVTALGGVDGVLLSPRAFGDRLADIAALRPERIVVVSSLTIPFPVGEPRFREHFAATEDAVRAMGPQWTMLRCADFAANTFAWAGQIKATGTVRGAYAAARTSTVDERDLAEVGVLALTSDGHAGEAYVLTGEQSLSQAEKVAAIGTAIGRELSFVEVEPEAVRQGLLAAGLPAEVPARLLGSQADYAREPGPTTDTVRRLLGRPARSFPTWAADHAAAFRV
ncbi:MAG: NAD(P)H-binding protein [Hamadaea sp.]|uniref:NAD(P)H-binding protein n=1 Tax=Hamadaea sp. TaxID=2024425 RepID=UPI0017AD2AB2|nr:NAD(P)H-binding protein [Hamadaea sp.]NUR70733.1 NAD(P)H-binding protein [Hamadaea sp.]NUT21401.1 NAD(P)H-binding protein [Hamadaea sp.]